MFDEVMEWGIRRITGYLRNMDAEQRELLNQNGEFSESILSMEIHAFFREGEEWEAGLPDFCPEDAPEMLKRRLGLDKFGLFCVLMALLGELDYHFEKLFVYLNNDWNQRLLSVEWAIRLFTLETEADASYLTYFFPEGRLARWVLDVRAEGSGSGLRRGLKLKQPVLEFLLRAGSFEDKPFLKWNPKWKLHTGDGNTDWRTWLREDVCAYLESARGAGEEGGRSLLFHLRGEEREESFLYPIWYAERKKTALGILDYGSIREEPERLHSALEEIVLAGGILCLHNADERREEGKEPRRLAALLRQAAELLPVIFLLGGPERAELGLPWDMDYVPIELCPPEGERRRQLWKRLAEGYPVSEREWGPACALYSLGMQEIRQSLREAQRTADAAGEAQITESMLHGACRRQLEHNLQEWAVRVKTDYAWEDLVLPRQQKEELKQAANQIKYRRQVYEEWGFSGVLSYGTGLSVLLTGPPGTGKTMAAQVLAGAMGLELYKIQLPAVVSKYIGETEKNLRQIFREGKKSPAALFFDEADVLFGRRTEVKDSHDKYSNMEAAFLLQNMEEYAGVVILATNFPQNIDEAFRRRIKFTIEFSMPDRQHRRLLWEKSFPKQAPLGADVDLEYLAETFELSGSSIKNIAVNAAFLAAPGGEAVGMPHIIKALTGEYRKSGKYFSEEELL